MPIHFSLSSPYLILYILIFLLRCAIDHASVVSLSLLSTRNFLRLQTPSYQCRRPDEHPGRLARLSPSPASTTHSTRYRVSESLDDGTMNTTVGGSTLAASGAVTANATYYQAATQSNITAATAAISNALKFATSKSIRTSTIILASFNAFAAFITAVGIIHSCRTYHKRMQRRASDPSVLRDEWKSGLELTQSRPPSGLFYIHTVEVFPFLISLGTTVQSITFAAAQSVGLQALLSRGCAIVAIFMMPGKFCGQF